jgi:tetratricopeptide (TPR) repeat protein
MTDLTEQGIAALKEGRREEARQLLMDAIMHNPRDAAAWLWLAGMLDDDNEQRADCLRCVLEIEPDNTTARIDLEQIEAQHALTAIHCSVCGTAGRIVCPKCGGSRTELCSTCQGQTFCTCSACHGLGWLSNEAALPLSTSLKLKSGEAWQECAQCHATGFVDCPTCRARGRDWCHTCEGSGEVVCPNCAPDRLKPVLGEGLAEAVLSGIWSDNARAQMLLAGLQESSPLAGFLWRIGFADRPYHSVHRLRTWLETHPDDKAGHYLLALLPPVPYQQLPPREKPVQLIKKQTPTIYSSKGSTRPLISLTHPRNALRDAIMAARIGNRDQALVLLLQAVAQEPRNEEAWLWLSRMMDTDAQRIECLRHVIEINPGNEAAQAELARLQKNTSGE